ncbi:MAG TPA: TonB-dependent receptor [Pelobium sp.]
MPKVIVRTMKLTIAILLIATFQVSAFSVGFAQQVTLNEKGAGLEKIFKEIGKQTNLNFIYDADVLQSAKPVTINVASVDVKTALDICFKQQPFTFQIKNQTIIVKPVLTKITQAAPSQSVDVKGKVTDEKGLPLIGVTVKIKGTNQGTVTNVYGNFSLSVQKADVLIFSYLGFKTQEITYNGDATLNVRLTVDNKGLDEIVVVGYGTQKRVNVTGSISTVSEDEIKNNLGTSTSQVLQGIVPNMNINLSSGDINDDPTILIRGIGSINGGSPLIVIDGVPGDINKINPHDIESISVLKDAASASIYGSRAAFGVILISTKTGKDGRIIANYGSNFGWSSPTIRTDNFITNGLDWARLSDKLSLLENSSTYLGYSQDDYDYLEARKLDPTLPSVLIKTVNGAERYVHYGDTDWWNTIFSNAQASQEHNIDLSGGTDKAKFYLSARYLNRDGIYKINPDVLNTYNIRNRLSLKPAKWIEIANSVNIYKKNYDSPATNARNVDGTKNSEDWRKFTYHAPPIYLPYNPDGSLIIKGAYTNNRDIADGTFADLLYGKSFANEKDFEVSNSSYLTLNLAKNLTVKADYSFRNRTQNELVRLISAPFTNQPNGAGVSLYKTNTQIYKELQRNTLYQAINAYGQYQFNAAKDLSVTAVLGYNQEWNNFKRNIASRNGNLSENLSSFNLASGDNIFLGSDENEYAIRAGFYRLSFNFKERYLLESNGRYDLSSRFPSAKRSSFFPSLAAGWIVSNEDFWQTMNAPVNRLKIRASYGELGNQDVGPYDYISTFGVKQGSYISNNALTNYLTTPQPVSSNFTWETAKTTNFGIDIGLFDNRFDASFDLFQRDVVNMLTQGEKLPSVFGAAEPKENAADLRTKGFELSTSWRDQFKLSGSAFKYNLSFTLGDSRTQITKFSNPNGDIQQYYVGQEIGEIWGYTVDGFFQTDDEYLTHADQKLVNQRITNNYLINHPVAGDIKFKDVDGNNVINPGDITLANHGDLKRIGNSTPRYNYGFRLGGEFKGFDFSVFAQGVMKLDWLPGTDNGFFWGPFSRQYQNFYPKSIEANSWTPTNPGAYFPRLATYAERGGPYEGAQLGVNSDKYLQNAAYLRIKNITVGYSIPQKISGKVHLDNVRLYLTGVNLFTFSPIYKNNPDRTIDPEQLGNGNDYPFTKLYSFGIQVKL